MSKEESRRGRYLPPVFLAEKAIYEHHLKLLNEGKLDALLQSYYRSIDKKVNAALGFGRTSVRSLDSTHLRPLHPLSQDVEADADLVKEYNGLQEQDKEKAVQIKFLLSKRTELQRQAFWKKKEIEHQDLQAKLDRQKWKLEEGGYGVKRARIEEEEVESEDKRTIRELREKLAALEELVTSPKQPVAPPKTAPTTPAPKRSLAPLTAAYHAQLEETARSSQPKEVIQKVDLKKVDVEKAIKTTKQISDKVMEEISAEQTISRPRGKSRGRCNCSSTEQLYRRIC